MYKNNNKIFIENINENNNYIINNFHKEYFKKTHSNFIYIKVIEIKSHNKI
jgi:hypothetical protein